MLRDTVNPHHDIPGLPGGSLIFLFTRIFIAVAALPNLVPPFKDPIVDERNPGRVIAPTFHGIFQLRSSFFQNIPFHWAICSFQEDPRCSANPEFVVSIKRRKRTQSHRLRTEVRGHPQPLTLTSGACRLSSQNIIQNKKQPHGGKITGISFSLVLQNQRFG